MSDAQTTTAREPLARKLARAAAACAYVQKDKANDFHRYRYASAAAIAERVNPALAAEGIAVTAKLGVESIVEVKNNKGNIERLYTVRVTLRLTDGVETLETEGLGSGMDGADKGIMKATTAATKYAWNICFSISTGDDPEDDPETDRNHNPEPTKTAPKKTGKAAAPAPNNAVDLAPLRAKFATAKGAEWVPLAIEVDAAAQASGDGAIADDFGRAFAEVIKRAKDPASITTIKQRAAKEFPPGLLKHITKLLDDAAKGRLDELARARPANAAPEREPGAEG